MLREFAAVMPAVVAGVLALAIAGCSSMQAGPVQAGPVEGQDWTSPTTGMEFVWIDELEMWVGKYEVTNAEYRRKVPGHDSKSYKNHSLNGDRQPVVRVNFSDAKSYAQWLTRQDQAKLGGFSYRLPSEPEWVAYAQCGDDREYPWGNNWPPRSGQAGNYHGQEGAGTLNKISGYNDGFPVTAPVDKLWRNPWGLYGVGGNVWEACAKDSSGGSFGAWRGASWNDYGQGTLRVSARHGRRRLEPLPQPRVSFGVVALRAKNSPLFFVLFAANAALRTRASGSNAVA